MKKLLIVGVVLAAVGIMFWMVPQEDSPREDMTAGVGFFNAANSGGVVSRPETKEVSTTPLQIN